MSGCVRPIPALAESVSTAAGQSIAALPAVLDPAQLSKHLEFFSSSPWNWGGLRDVRVQTLKAHQNRCTVEICLRTTGGLRTLIGKAYAQDRSDVYDAMEAIRRAGFGPDAEFSIPQPFAFLPALNLLIQEKVCGVRAKDVFLRGSERDCADAAQRCALWLARFQTLAPRAGPVLDVDRYFASLEHWKRPAAAGNERLADKAGFLLERLKAVAPAPSGRQLCAGHDSFCYSQVILARRRTVIYDWDGYDMADPSRDVARFIIALSRVALRYLGSIHAMDHIAEIFLNTYLAGDRQDVQQRLPFFKAGTCIKLAKYEIPRPSTPERKVLIGALLDEGFRILGQWR